jgi:hypothetical protein
MGLGDSNKISLVYLTKKVKALSSFTSYYPPIPVTQSHRAQAAICIREEKITLLPAFEHIVMLDLINL